MKRNIVYCVMVCNKGSIDGRISSLAFDSLEKTQNWCESRFDTHKVHDYFYSSDAYDYRIIDLTVN